MAEDNVDASLAASSERQAVRALLERAVVDLGPLTPPRLTVLDTRRSHRPRARSVLAVACAVACVIALAAIEVASQNHGRGTQTASDADTLPGYVGPRISVATLATYKWSTLPIAPIPARTDPAAVWTGEEMIVWGGARGNELERDGAAYNPTTRTWTTLPPSPLTARASMSATWVDGTMIIWGGEDDSGPVDGGARYIPASRTWALLPAPPAAGPPGASQLVTVGSTAVLIRNSRMGTTGYTVHVDAYDPTTNRWRHLPDYHSPSTHAIMQTDALAVGSDVFLWSEWVHTESGGTASGVDSARLDVEASANGWSRLAAEPGGEALIDQPAWTGKQILFPQTTRFCGGCAGPPLSQITSVLIDPVTGEHSSIPSGPASIEGGEIVWTGAAVLAAGNKAAAWDPTTGTWTQLSSPPNTDRFDTVRIWTGTRLIFWGYADSRTSTNGIEFAPS